MPNIKHLYEYREYTNGIPEEIKTKAAIYSPSFQISEKYVSVNIIWDTGATHSCISSYIMKELNLESIDSMPVCIAGKNKKDSPIVVASISLPNDISFKDRRFTVLDELPELEVLIGMDIITSGDFAITNGGGKTRFSFITPPFEENISFIEKADAINNQ